MVKVVKPGRRAGSVLIPSSKSIAHRELIAAALSGGVAPIVRGESKDIIATRNCLKAMMNGEHVWPCGESGTTLRLLEPIAGVMGFKGEFKCEGRLGTRPRMRFERKTQYVIPGNISSQFVSGLLMALPLADYDSEIVVEGELQSAAYVALTEDTLKESGINFEKQESVARRVYSIKGNQRYRFAGGREIEGDWSQAAFFMAMGVEVDGLNHDSRQGDRAITGLLPMIDQAEKPITIDVSQVPDLYPCLAAYAAAKNRPVDFSGTERLRLKESDRLASTAAMIEAVKRGKTVDAAGDHRIAMSAAMMATYGETEVTIEGAECVDKSYPEFWEHFEKLTIDGR